MGMCGYHCQDYQYETVDVWDIGQPGAGLAVRLLHSFACLYKRWDFTCMLKV
jgi:hypothetical protein